MRSRSRSSTSWSATDVGKAINPVMCKGPRLRGGSLQAIGWAVSEEITLA
jgi:CO/xanthine dehydrogenase Mo-binding subunit